MDVEYRWAQASEDELKIQRSDFGREGDITTLADVASTGIGVSRNSCRARCGG